MKMQNLNIDLNASYAEYLAAQYKNCISSLQKLAKQGNNLNIQHNIYICEYLQNRSPLQAYNTLNKLCDLVNDMNTKKIIKNPKNPKEKLPDETISQIMIQENVLKYNIAILMGVIARRDSMQMVLDEIYNTGTNPFSWRIAFLLLESKILLDKKIEAVDIIKQLHSCRNMPRKVEQRKGKFTGFSFPDNGAQQNCVSHEQYNYLLDIFKAEICLKYGYTKSAFKLLPKRETSKLLSIIKQAAFSYKNTNMFELNLITMLKFANAHYEYQTKCYQKALKLLSPNNLMESDINSNKYLSGATYLSHNNIGLINYKLQKYTLALFYISKGLESLSKFNMPNGDEREQIVVQHYQSKHEFLLLNQALVLLKLGKNKEAYEHFSKINKSTENFKFWYRFGEASLKYFHDLLQENKSIHESELYDEIHDNYQPTYSYPNLPYVKLHGDDKKKPNNPVKAPCYRRYILHKSDHFIQQQSIEEQKKISKRQSALLHLKSVLNKAQNSFENSLICLLKSDLQKKVQNLNFKNIGDDSQIEAQEEQAHTKKMLIHQFYNFKQSTLVMLAYISLCKQHFSKTIKLCQQVLSITKLTQQNGYIASMYLVEAYLETQKYHEALEISSNRYLKVQGRNHVSFKCRDSLAASEAYFQNMGHDNIIRYNIAVLHIKGNNIIQANLVIQTLLNEMGIVQNSYTAKIPVSILNLLIYWYLRTDNSWAALQLIKRRRILTLAGMNNNKALLKITK